MKYKWLILILIIILVGLGCYFILTQKSNEMNNTIVDEPEKVKASDPIITTYDVPILMYHYIRIADPADTLGVGLSVTPKNFETQIKWLKENDYITIRLEDLADPQKTVLSKVKALNKKPVIITFDDGYDNAYTEAYPILKKYDFIGAVFIIRDFVGRSEYATQPQIDEMANYGMEIGSHTLSHVDLSKNPLEIDKKQIFDSKLYSQIFCYPAGKYNEETVNLVKEAGYLIAVTTKPGIANQDSNLFELPRVRIKNVDLEIFIKQVQRLE